MKEQLRNVLVLAVFVLLGFYFWKTEVLATYLVEPIARVLWLFIRILQSVDQDIYWFLLIFTILPLIIRMLPVTAEYSIKPAYKSSYQKNDRVMYWEAQIKAAERDKYDRLRLQRSLQTIAQSIEDLFSRNDKAIILLPSIKRGCLEWVRKVNVFLPLFQHTQQKKAHHDSELEKCIDQILKSMENQMEETND